MREVQELKVDSKLLKTIVRRRKRLWIGGGILVFLLLWLGQLFFLPQSFLAVTSFAMQRNATGGGSSPLAALAGVAMPNRPPYLGVLRSRRFAESVERRVNIRPLMRFKSFEDTVDYLQKNVKADEGLSDGLMYIKASLEGPARLAPNAEGQRKKIKEAAAQVANAYAQEMLVYLKQYDTERESVISRQAENEMNRARQNYTNAVTRLVDLVRKSPKGEALTALSVGGSRGTGLTQGATGLQSLYLRRGQLEEQLQALEATRTATANLLQQPPKTLAAIPDEDPLLTEARAEVNAAIRRLNALRITLAEENPRVVESKRRLQQAEDRLKAKVDAILNGQTTEAVRRQALQASYETVLRQIAEETKHFQVGREIAADYELLHNEVDLSLEVLKRTATQYAELRLSTVSGQNRMTVVDDARPPIYGRPGIGMEAVVSLIGALGLIFLWGAGEYLLRTLQSDSA